ncbi:MAG TPA: UDP-glucose 4-epimerase GalE [Terriglobales bacterium]|nr:UDP-glucose 4-epimerase GalE [Terriglobales bacterium]
MRILVTGGAGYVGSVSVEAFVAAGHEVTVLDDLSTGHRSAVAEGAALEVGTYGDSQAVARLLGRRKIDAVLHCAAKSLVGESMVDPAKYFLENVGGGINLLEGMRLAGVKRIVLSSTAATYGMPERTPILETDPVRPINAYGESKRCVEAAITWYGHGYGLRSVILRYFNVAGASRVFGENHAPETHLIPVVLSAAEESREMTIFGDDYPTPDGTCVRDYIHVEDLAAAHLLALVATDPGDARTGPSSGPCQPVICNLGNGTGFSNREIVAAAEAVVGHAIPVKIGPRRAGDPPVLVASAERAGRELGWQPRHGKLDGIVSSAWEWRRAHPTGYKD